MRRAALIYNPSSGSKRARRVADVESAAAVLRTAGVGTEIIATRAAGSATEQAAEAIAGGCDVVFACGGDGTVHEVLQAVVAGENRAALGIIPLGTGNLLATDLGLPRSPAAAARLQAEATPLRVAAGRIEYRDRRTGAPGTRYFTVAAGVGVDAWLAYRVDSGMKEHHGMAAYMREALRVFATGHFGPFVAEFEHNGTPRRELVSEVVAMRINNMGFGMSSGAALERDALQLMLFKTPSRFTYLLFFTSLLLRWRWDVRGVELLNATTVDCRSAEAPDLTAAWRRYREAKTAIFSQADGELLGALPVRLSIVRDAFTVLAPPGRFRAPAPPLNTRL
jgi:diacylglycerol kinase family enzyme